MNKSMEFMVKIMQNLILFSKSIMRTLVIAKQIMFKLISLIPSVVEAGDVGDAAASSSKNFMSKNDELLSKFGKGY